MGTESAKRLYGACPAMDMGNTLWALASCIWLQRDFQNKSKTIRAWQCSNVVGLGEKPLRRSPRYQDAEFRQFLRRYQWRALWLGKKRAMEKAHLDVAAGAPRAFLEDALEDFISVSSMQGNASFRGRYVWHCGHHRTDLQAQSSRPPANECCHDPVAGQIETLGKQTPTTETGA